MSDILAASTPFDPAVSAMQMAKPDSLARLHGLKNSKDLNMQQIDKAAKEFEAVFVAEMLKPMFEGISTDGEFGGGQGEEIFRGMMLDEYGKVLANTGSIGIADRVREELIRMQSGENTQNAKTLGTQKQKDMTTEMKDLLGQLTAPQTDQQDQKTAQTGV